MTSRLASFLDKSIAVFSPERALRRKEARTKLELSATLHRGAETSRLMADWILGRSNPTPDCWELDTLRERSRDLNRNDPVACGATDTLGINIIGSGLKPQSKIRASVLGIADDAAISYQKQAESIFEAWSAGADAGNRLNFDEIQFLALRKIIEDGEVFAIPTWANEPWRNLRRVIEMAESERCASDKEEFDQGIQLGTRGQPLAYSFSIGNASDILAKPSFKVVAARDAKGRPNVLHVFRSNRIGQIRGVPAFAPAMSFFKHLSDYLEAEVVSARVAACLAVFVTSGDPMGLASANSSGAGADGNRIQTIEPGLVHYLGNGESINVVDPKRPGDAFASFVEGVLRLIGVSLGMPYELLLKDFSKTNYSSARAALLEGRRQFMGWRNWFAPKFCQPIWCMVLEEAYLRGQFDVPDFYAYQSEYCRCSWIGGAWGWVDPVKEVEASKMAMDYGLSTLAEEVAGQGRDWEEVLEQKAKEQKKITELGLNLSSEKVSKPTPSDPGTAAQTP